MGVGDLNLALWTDLGALGEGTSQHLAEADRGRGRVRSQGATMANWAKRRVLRSLTAQLIADGASG